MTLLTRTSTTGAGSCGKVTFGCAAGPSADGGCPGRRRPRGRGVFRHAADGQGQQPTPAAVEWLAEHPVYGLWSGRYRFRGREQQGVGAMERKDHAAERIRRARETLAVDKQEKNERESITLVTFSEFLSEPQFMPRGSERRE